MLVIIDMTGENNLSEEENEEKINDNNISKKDYFEEIIARLPQLQIIEA